MSMPDTPLGALLASAPPVLTDAQATALARDHFGVTGSLRRLTSERDLNFHIVAPAGQFVLKIANLAEPRAVTNLQTAALLHLERHAPDLPVPRVIHSLDGRPEVDLPLGLVRLLSYLDGRMMHTAPRTPPLRRAMAAMAARLTLGLQGFTHPAATHVLQWDIQHSAKLRPLLPDIDDPHLRALAAGYLNHFDQSVAPRLPECRWQVVHNDLNPHNVVVDADDPSRLRGILDFGDMVHTPLICDLAIAASYQIDTADCLTGLTEMATAYHAVLPLTRVEAYLLYDLVLARMVTTIAITSWRAARYPGNAPYILRNFASARSGLHALAAIPRDAARAAIARACGQE